MVLHCWPCSPSLRGTGGGFSFACKFYPNLFDFVVLIAHSAGLGVLLFAGLWLVLPNEEISDEEGSVDWLGAGLGVGTLIVFNVAWKQVSTKPPPVVLH